MTYEEITAAMAALEAKLSAKGVAAPAVDMLISSRSCILLHGRHQLGRLNGGDSKCFHAETPAEMIAAADAFVDALPSPEEKVIATYTRKLADAVDYATDHALPAAAVAPVQAAIREVNATLLMKGAA